MRVREDLIGEGGGEEHASVGGGEEHTSEGGGEEHASEGGVSRFMCVYMRQENCAVCFVINLSIYRITGNVCVAKFLSFKFLRDLIFAQTEHAQYKMHVL